MDNSNSSNDREFLGVTQNECTFQGKVVGDPVVQSDNYAFLQLKTVISEQGANGQWNDVVVTIPIITMDTKKVDVIRKYIQDGRELLVYTYYKPWVANGQPQHAFIAKKIQLGRKKWVPVASSDTPALPVQ